jgi:hypothetical protein
MVLCGEFYEAHLFPERVTALLLVTGSDCSAGFPLSSLLGPLMVAINYELCEIIFNIIAFSERGFDSVNSFGSHTLLFSRCSVPIHHFRASLRTAN